MKLSKMKPSSTWSPLSNVTVNLKASKDYQKLLMLMYAVVAIALFTSDFYGLFSFILSFCFSAYFIYLSRLKTPGAFCVRIEYIQQQWQIYQTPTQFEIYKTARIKFDFGWLIWLVFEGESKLQVLIFRDQISLDAHRALRVLLRVI
ncbi:MAG: hypothetical protein QNK11_07780 [Legionella sp.]|nr:hypothetical protein [Legionella sp.]